VQTIYLIWRNHGPLREEQGRKPYRSSSWVGSLPRNLRRRNTGARSPLCNANDDLAEALIGFHAFVRLTNFIEIEGAIDHGL